MLLSRLSLLVVAGLGTSVLALGCAADATSDGVTAESSSSSDLVVESSIASLALANVGKLACSENSRDGHAYGSSCTGNGGHPEYWCADFVKWVWQETGASDVGELTAAAGSFYTYGQRHNTLSGTPKVGDAVVYNYQGGGVADHVAVVVKLSSNGTIETVSGDWSGHSGSEAEFASTSHTVLNAPAYPGRIGEDPPMMGMHISGFISPVGLTTSAPKPAPTPTPTPAPSPTPVTTPIPKAPAGCGEIAPGEGLKAGEQIHSCNEEYTLAMQTDGNLVLYHNEPKGQVALWATFTDRTGDDKGYVATMQTDGNLVVYGDQSNALWSSATAGHRNVEYLSVQGDGNLVIYEDGNTPLWATYTEGR